MIGDVERRALRLAIVTIQKRLGLSAEELDERGGLVEGTTARMVRGEAPVLVDRLLWLLAALREEGEKLRAVRVARGLSPEDLDYLAELPEGTVRDLEAGLVREVGLVMPVVYEWLGEEWKGRGLLADPAWGLFDETEEIEA